MKQSLQIKIGQSLAMTPQLQQAIRLLQLSTLELQAEIQEALEANPLLEVTDEAENGSTTEAPEAPAANADEPAPQTANDTAESNDSGDPAPDATVERDIELNGDTNEINSELSVDTDWDELYDSGVTPLLGRPDDDNRDFTEYHSGDEANLHDHLLEQIYLMPLSERDRMIASTIIESLEDDGYLREPLDGLIDGINASLDAPDTDPIDPDEVDAMLRLVQRLEPAGCGARDLQECLCLQLQILESSPAQVLALKIAAEHLDSLASRDVARLKRVLKTSDQELEPALEMLRHLSPRPGTKISASDSQYIVPDVIVRRTEHGWTVELNPEIAPRLGINATYANLVKRADKSDDNTFIRNHLQEARWFIKSLQSRNETLLRVATAIVDHQQEYFEHGEVAMKPLVLRDIAEQLSMHESTISRVTTQKYMHTPRGNLEFKYFFSSHVSTTDGGECSATAIRAMIKQLLAKENPRHPLSDSKIANLLVADGINVARRTIAKYREAMSVPPSNERKRLS